MWQTRKSVVAAKPDFLILGAKRSGTTSLFYCLMQHPATASPMKKELDYLYAKDFNPSKYQKYFPVEGYTGEATPNYLITQVCARRIKEINPNVKLIALLREPVARILSEYPKQVARGIVGESLASLTRVEKKRLSEISIEAALCDLDYFHRHRRTSYLLRGLYFHALKMWYDVFPSESLLVLSSEQLFENPRASVNQVLEFLSLEPCNDISLPKLNSTSEWAEEGNPTVSIGVDLLEELALYFAPYNEQLCQFLGRDFGWVAPTQFDGG